MLEETLVKRNDSNNKIESFSVEVIYCGVNAVRPSSTKEAVRLPEASGMT
jgi:hypothetical protein